MFKLVLILVLVYLLYRAGSNLLKAAMQDGLVRMEGGQKHRSSPSDDSPVRRKNGRQEIEDAVWEDLP